MKIAALTLALAHLASAHYYFENVMLNGGAQPNMKYIRKFTRQTWYNPTKFRSNPAADIRDNAYIDSVDGVCNQGGAGQGPSTEVLTVKAGEEVRVRLNGAGNFQHPGPGLVYMSRAPGDNVKNYDGSGQWFKIFQEGVCNQGGDFKDSAWCTHNRNWLAAKIPKDTPSGEYLMRFEHIGVHRSHVNQPEHYMSCVQVKVTDGGSGNPSPTVRFPGAYSDRDPYATMSVYNGIKPFTFPGPAVWSGGGSGSNPSNPTNPTNPTNPGNGGGGGGGGNCAAMYEQCGGNGFNGPKCCSAGSCKVTNEWYSQCV